MFHLGFKVSKFVEKRDGNNRNIQVFALMKVQCDSEKN